MTLIKIKTQFEDYHYWSEAPKEVCFLQNLHRHLFYVIVKIQVRNDDRELEYFITKRIIDKVIKESVIPMEPSKSCEMMAEKLLDFLELDYPDRFIEVEVNEDNENGSIINNNV